MLTVSKYGYWKSLLIFGLFLRLKKSPSFTWMKIWKILKRKLILRLPYSKKPNPVTKSRWTRKPQSGLIVYSRNHSSVKRDFLVAPFLMALKMKVQVEDPKAFNGLLLLYYSDKKYSNCSSIWKAPLAAACWVCCCGSLWVVYHFLCFQKLPLLL